jgi:alcohol dehydrogenase class IV
MGLTAPSTPPLEAVAVLVKELKDLNKEFEVPSPSSYGIDPGKWENLLPLMAEQALASGSPGNNPRVPTTEEIIALYRQVWS